MASITYIAKREIEPTGFSKTGTDLSAIGSDDSFDAATTDLSGLLTDQWLLAAGFAKNPGWFQVKSNSTSAKILTNTPPTSHLRLSGAAGNYASTPDSAANSVTGDIDIRVKAAPIDWTSDAVFLGKWLSTGNQRSYFLSTGVTGLLALFWSNDGTALINVTSTAAFSIADGSTKWIRATLDVDNGAAGRDIKFYTSDDGVIWTQLGATVTQAGTTAIFNSTAAVEIGSTDGGTGNLFDGGRIYYAEIRNGINGPVVAAFDPSRGARGAGSLVAATGEIWTINTSGTPPALLQGPLLTYEGAEYLSLPGIVGNYASTPDSAANSVTGDLDLRAFVAATDWTPGAVQTFVAKFTSSGNQQSYNFDVDTNGTLKLVWSADGTSVIQKNSTVATGLVDGSGKWVRATLDVDNGAAGNDVKFYTSDDGVAWTQLGATVTTAGTTSIFNSTSVLEIGSSSAGTVQPFVGKVYYAEVRAGLNGLVMAAFDSARAAAGATSLTGYTGEAWTINVSGSPAAALVRTAPVTITGYVRGYGQSYGMDFNLTAYERGADVSSNESQPIGGGAPEVLLNRIDSTADVTTGLLSEAQLAQWREFRSSVWAGEIFTFDPYGSIAVPSTPHQAILMSKSWKEARHDVLMLYRISFNMRLLT